MGLGGLRRNRTEVKCLILLEGSWCPHGVPGDLNFHRVVNVVFLRFAHCKELLNYERFPLPHSIL
jgi:hypothetical protein